MIIKCQNGYFKFFEYESGEISDYMRFTGFSFVRKGDFYTFKDLDLCPNFSIKGMPYLEVTAKKNYEGEIEEIFLHNDFIFDFRVGLIRDISSISLQFNLYKTKNQFISNGLILPGSITQKGKRILGYTCYYQVGSPVFKYSEVEIV